MTIALFDFDGTITTHETMPAFIRQSTSTPRLLIGYLFLWPLLIGYKLGVVSGITIRAAIVRAAYMGADKTRIDDSGATFAQNYLSRVLRPEAMERIAWHRAQGHDVAVISGGLDCYLRPWTQKHGLRLICSSLEERNGKLTGRYKGPQCVRREKAQAARNHFGPLEGRRVYAYGDTSEDKDLLAIATDPYYREMPTLGG